METPRLIAAILSCGYLDSEYLLRLIAAYDLDLADLVDDVSEYRGTSRATVNDLIGAAYERVAQEFLIREVKHHAVDTEQSLSAIVTTALERYLRQQQPRTRKA